MNGPADQRWPGLERLQQLAAARPRRAGAEVCEMCGAEISPEHGHVVNVQHRSLLCACRPCYLLFAIDTARPGRFVAVPQRYRWLPELGASATAWDALPVPIGLVFLFRSSASGRLTAFYPSPAGATESELPLDAWEALVTDVPVLATLAPDVEAVLLRRGDTGTDAVIAPIDACYELTGRIRRRWRGFQGGDEMWRDVDGFFSRARALAGEARP